MTKYKRPKLKNWNWNSLFFVISIIASVLFLAIPLFLKCPIISKYSRIFLSSLGEYKASYFEACGAMIGGFLAVTSAIWAQRRSEIKQNNELLKKYATIVYFDIKKFYEENDVFASRVIESLEKCTNNHSHDRVLRTYTHFKEYVSIHLDPNWISSVAELGSVLEKTMIDEIYRFYGNAEYVKYKVEKLTKYNYKDIELIGKNLREIGERKPAYQPNGKILSILNTLDALIQNLK